MTTTREAPAATGPPAPLVIQPLTSERWDDLVALFLSEDVTRRCWCMWWRTRSTEYQKRRRADNREAFRRRVQAPDAGRGEGAPPGMLAYVGGRPVGWVSVAPRREFTRLAHSHGAYRYHGDHEDHRRMWSILCFFVHRDHRGQSVAGALLGAANGFAREHGAEALEAVPTDPQDPAARTLPDGRVRDTSAWPGVMSLFTRVGFTEVARSKGRPLVRLLLA